MPNAIAAAIGCTLSRASTWAPHLNAAMVRWGIDTPVRAAHFLAQIAVESGGLTRLEEGLSYSAERLTMVWPSRFPTLAAAQRYVRNPQALANNVYGGRMGNTQPGDGWLYRGRGLEELTGKTNYAAYLMASGVDCLSDPNLLLQPQHAADSADWFWSSNGCNTLADKGDVTAPTRRINGGLTGLEQRKASTLAALRALEAGR